mgnify:CR=1 FL=1
MIFLINLRNIFSTFFQLQMILEDLAKKQKNIKIIDPTMNDEAKKTNYA